MKRIALAIFSVFVFIVSNGSTGAQEEVRYYLRGESRVVLPGSHLVFRRYNYDNAKDRDYSASLYRIDDAHNLKWVSGGSSVLTARDLHGLELVKTVHGDHVEGTEAQVSTFDFGVLPIGRYLTVADSKTSAWGSVAQYNVGTLGTVWHAANGTMVVYAVDLRTMRHRDDVQYVETGREGARHALVSMHGLSWRHGVLDDSSVIFGRASDGSTTIQRIWGGAPAGAMQGYVQTDRPVYRTGQHVYVRAILRTGPLASYSVASGKQKVTVRSPDGTTMFERTIVLNAFGTLAADFDIPESAKLGYYQISVGTVSSGFSVQEYKKPEYLLGVQVKTLYVVGGDNALFDVCAKYFFGRPAAGMTIHYNAGAGYYYFPSYNPYRFHQFLGGGGDFDSAADAFEATGQADESGRLSIAIPTKHKEYERTLSLQVDGRDASGRTVSTQASALIVPASFRITLKPDRWYVTLGQTLNVAIATEDYEARARPNTPLAIGIDGTRYDYQSHKAEKLPLEEMAVTTDARGRAALPWHPSRAGSYSIRISGKDERGNVTSSSLYFWVSSDREPWWYPDQGVTLIPDKEQYAPGERPRLLLTVPQADADALLIVNDDRIESARVLHVGSKPQTLIIDPPKNATRYLVRVEIPGKSGLSIGEVLLNVTPAPRQLSVSVVAEKAKYSPGESATFRVHVKDRSGRAVRAELALGVVDESLYAVQEENRESAMARFYDNRLSYIQSNSSWYFVSDENAEATPAPSAAPARAGARMLKEIAHVTSRGSSRVIAGTTADVYSVNGTAVPVRSFFPDTAYWKPDVVTDAQGNATASFTWPDSLTTWRASAVAVTQNTDVGDGKGTALVTKDFLVRLEMPRFLRRGDRSQFTGIVNGRAGSRDASLTLDAGDLVRSASDQMVRLDSNATASANWDVNPLTSLGMRDITLKGSDGSLMDAMRLQIPIEAAGAAEHVRDAAEVHDKNATSFALPQMYDPGSLRITLSPSVLASLIQNVRLLDVYPYFCTEQTMSAALPAVFLDRVFKRAGISAPADSPRPSQIVAKAVKRLGDLQHDDGSWGWWESDNAHPFMTAYALYGLAEFRKSGYAVPPVMLSRGIESLLAQIKSNNDDTLRLWGGRQPNSQWNTRAFMLFSLSDAAPERMDRTALSQTLSHAGELNDYALALLGLAEHQLGDDATARTLLARLNAHAVEQPGYTFWLGQTWHYAWQDDPIETTAYALRLNNALEPSSQRVKNIVNFLRTQQRGNWWYTTKDTAAAVYAIAESVPVTSDEFHPDENVAVFVGEKRIASLHITKAVLDQHAASITVDAAEFERGGAMRIEQSGRGSLYWDSDWVRYAPPYARKVFDAEESILSRLRAKPSSFSIERRYHAPHTPWRVGDEIDVDVMVRADSDTDYVAIEDPFPAAAEYQPLQGEAGEQWSGLQFFDDRAVFFADHLYSGYPLHLRYSLRVTTPGVYTAAPSTAYAMYGPPVSTVGQPDQVTVK